MWHPLSGNLHNRTALYFLTSHALCAVSYTHLDVYKRQGVDIAVPTGTLVYAAHDGTVTEAAYDSYSVSYTHLDVYKRQKQ